MPSDSPREVRVLVADDDAHNRQLLGEVCRGEGYQVDLVEDGDAAVKRAISGDYHVLLLDASMPGLSGYEVMERLRDEPATEHLPIIMITAHPHDASRALAERLGVFAYIEKPFRLFDLTQRIRLALRQRRADMDPPTLPRVRAHRALGDALPRLPSPHQLRPYLRRALEESLAAKRAIVCIVLRLENGPLLLQTKGRTARDAALGAMLSHVQNLTGALVFRSDDNELLWLWADHRVGELVGLLSTAKEAIARAFEEPAEISLSLGATIISATEIEADADRVVRAARLLATRARRSGDGCVVDEYAPPASEPGRGDADDDGDNP